RAQEIDRILFGDRQITRIAVDGARRRVDDAAQLKVAGSEQHVERDADVDRVVAQRVLGREHDVAGSSVNDEVAVTQDLAQQLDIEDAAVDHVERGSGLGKIRASAGG